MELLILDDEQLQVKLLKEIVARRYVTFGIFTATTVLDAISIINKNNINIILTDICMPGITGLEFIKKINENENQYKVIFITGYEEFEYAKQAIDLGVMSYLLKPFKEQDIYEVIDKAIALVNSDIDKMPVISDKILLARFKHNKNVFDIPMNQSGTMLIVQEKKDVNFKHAARNMIESVSKLIRVPATWIKSEMGYLWYVDTRNEDEKSLFLKKLAKVSLNGYEFKDTIKYMSISELALSNEIFSVGMYIEAKTALQKSFYEPNEKIFPYKMGMFSVDVDYQCYAERALDIYKNIHKFSNLTEIELLIKNTLIGKEKLLHPEVVTHLVFQIVRIVIDGLNVYKNNKDNLCLQSLRYELMYCKKLTDLINVSAGYILQAIQQSDNSKTSIDENLMKKCITYIENQPYEQLTMAYVARIFNYNPSYFSNYFRAKMGKTFSQYIKEIKINHAKKLLIDTDKKTLSIATELGFSSERYFRILFKKETGYTTSEWRRKSIG